MYVGSTPQPRLIEFGATCTLALLRSSLLAVGNAGDSAAVLGRCETHCRMLSWRSPVGGEEADDFRRNAGAKALW